MAYAWSIAQHTANVNKVNPPKGDTPVIVAKNPPLPKPIIPKPPPPKPVTPKPTQSKNYNGSRADLIKLFMTGDPKAAWVLGEKAPNKIEKYKWWAMATFVSEAKHQGAYRPQETARLKATITSSTDQQNFANWQQNIAPTVTIISEGKGVSAWLSELQRKNLLPR